LWPGPSGNDDYGPGTVPVFQKLQMAETAHLPHLDIRDDATRSGKGTGFQKLSADL
jgi:hypothetical protein